MILYFADRMFSILGSASTGMLGIFPINDDLKTEDVETGVSSFECYIPYTDGNRKEVERITEVGNYLLRKHNGENEFYTIIESESDTKNKEVYIYAEDAGLDLLNEIVGAYTAEEAKDISFYIDMFAYDSGFEIGINEAAGLTRALSWDGEATATERIASVAKQFGSFEISYSFRIKGLEITRKYINIYKKRGKDSGVQLRLNNEIDRIVTKKSIANLATALICTGGTPEESETPITLEGYEYDDGDFYVAGKYLYSRNALKKWTRYIWNKEPNKINGQKGHIVQPFSYDTTSQKELCAHAATKLKELCEIEVNFEIDVNILPENVEIGDRVDVVDDAGELYVSSRVLKLETSVANKTQTATIGEHLIKSGGISQKVSDLADKFADFAEERNEANKKLDEASQAAKDAQAAADNAQAAADEAAQAAAQAKADAAEAAKQVIIAEGKAESAIEKAETAQTTAEQASVEANNAKATADAAKLDAQAAQNDIDNLGEQLTTVSNTMQADYARKTDLAEATASLQTQISQNAAEISSTATKVQTIDETVNNAAEQASQAVTTAQSAKEQADAAAADALEAQKAAQIAANAASDAQTQANTAKTAAENAQTQADIAKAQADQAQADLDAAKENLDAVSSKVDATEAEVAAAQQAVIDAQAAADKAKSDADAAQAAADQAAADAQRAETVASKAKNTADAAQAAADKAQADADAAKAAADALAVRVTEAETKITQNAEKIELAATKAEVEQTLGGYYKKEESDAALQVKADEISSTVDKKIADIKIGARNLYIIKDSSEGYLPSSGTTLSAMDSTRQEHTSDFIAVKSGEQFVFQSWATIDESDSDPYLWLAYVFFDSSKNRIGNRSTKKSNKTLADGKAYGMYEVTIPENASFLRVSARFYSDGKVKVEKGTKPTDWTPAPEDVDQKIDDTASEIYDTIENQNTSIVQTCESIIMQAVSEYTTTGDFESFKETVSSQLALLSDQLEVKFTETTEQISGVNDDLQEKFNTVTKYFTFNIDGLTIGQEDNPNKVVIDNDEISILVDGNVVQRFDSEGKALIPYLKITESVDLFGFFINQDDDGNVNCE